MIVDEEVEWASYHAVLEICWALKGGDSNPHLHPDSEMPGLPLNFFARGNQSSSDATDGLFSGGCHGLYMKVNAAGEIKTSLSRRIDGGFENDFRVPPLACRPAGARRFFQLTQPFRAGLPLCRAFGAGEILGETASLTSELRGVPRSIYR